LAAASLAVLVCGLEARAAEAQAEKASQPAAMATPDKGPTPLKPPEGEGWKVLFDGKSLEGWKVTDFAGHGDVAVKDGNLVLEMGAMLTGVNLLKTNDIPKTGYEMSLDAMKTSGSDFFCGLTFRVGDACCSLIVGGWGGGLVGISSIDGNDASLNETTQYKEFESNRWYRIRVRVTAAKLEAWIDDKAMVDVKLEERRLSVRPGEIEMNQPFGIATYQTTAALRNIQWRRVP